MISMENMFLLQTFKFLSITKPNISFLSICILCALTFSCRQAGKQNSKEVLSSPSKLLSSEQAPLKGHLEQIDHKGKIRTLKMPAHMTFAGEKVPLDDIDVYERLEREIYVNTFWHSSTILLLKRASRWLPQISEILKENGIPDDFKYLAVIESGLMNVISPSNAVGFWQILKPTGKELGLEINKEVDERYDPIKSARAAAKYLKKSYNTFESWTNAAASYNRGVRGIRRELEQQQVSSYYDLKLNDETSRYVFRILAAKELLENAQAYGFDIASEERYHPEKTFPYEVTETIKDLSAFSVEKGINYKLLVRYNPWLRSNKLTVKGDKKYTLLLPTKFFLKETVALN